MATRLDRLSARRTDPLVANAKLLNEVYRDLAQSDSIRYAIGAMQPIDPEYTKNTYKQGDRVCNQLQTRLETTCDYEYQGSVTNNTHIKARSDIDVLLLIRKFFSVEPPQKPEFPYSGNPVRDLLDLRAETETSLTAAFPEATVDSSGNKSITIEGGSLRRKVDVVPANWFNTNRYAQTAQKIYRGVEILDKKKQCRLPNTPFLHNAQIDRRDQSTSGGLRKAARLMKSLKYDSDAIDLSSYDLVSIAYSIPDRDLNIPRGMELALLSSCYSFCLDLENDSGKRCSLKVPDGHREIFAEGHATLKGLNQLTAELASLINDVLNENQRSFRRLAEARVAF